MAFARRRETKGGKTRFLGIYLDVHGRERSAGSYDTEEKAVAAAIRQEERQALGQIGDRRPGRQTFGTYVLEAWLPNHVMELSTRQAYTYELNKHILPAFGMMRMSKIMPGDVRTWVTSMKEKGAKPPTIAKCKVILDAIFTTALNDKITVLHAGKGVQTPTVAARPRRIITAPQFDAIYHQLPTDTLRLLVETDIESGLRWGELTELRVRDLDLGSGMLTVCRVVVSLNSKFHPEGKRFFVKEYPKDKEWRSLKLPAHLVTKLAELVRRRGLRADDLLFAYEPPQQATRRSLPEVLPDPATLGWTEPNGAGRTYRHGTTTAYTRGECRCQHCRDAVAWYRAQRRADGKDTPRRPRTVNSDGHIAGDWFRTAVWNMAVKAAGLTFHVTPLGLRHAHASWLLAGGADVKVVMARLGHGSITTTARYLGTLPGADDAALTALDAIRGRREVPAVPDGHSPAAHALSEESDKDAKIRELEAKLAKFKLLLEE